jgi:hypothetical protein
MSDGDDEHAEAVVLDRGNDAKIADSIATQTLQVAGEGCR